MRSVKNIEGCISSQTASILAACAHPNKPSFSSSTCALRRLASGAHAYTGRMRAFPVAFVHGM